MHFNLKTVLLNIFNSLIIFSIILAILFLVFNFSEKNISSQTFNQYDNSTVSRIVSIKQLDSLSASGNLRFTKSFLALNQGTLNSEKN